MLYENKLKYVQYLAVISIIWAVQSQAADNPSQSAATPPAPVMSAPVVKTAPVSSNAVTATNSPNGMPEETTTKVVKTLPPPIPADVTTTDASSVNKPDSVNTVNGVNAANSNLDEQSAIDSTQREQTAATLWQNLHVQKMAERRARMERMRNMSPKERWEARRAELNARYQELRQQAAANGVDLSERTPWEESKAPIIKDSNSSQSGSINSDEVNTPEIVSDSFGDQMGVDANQTTAPQAMTDGMAPPPAPPSAPPSSNESGLDLGRMQAVINAMTPEEREVCRTVHLLSMGLMQSPPPPPPHPVQDRDYGPGYNTPPYNYRKNSDYNGSYDTAAPGYSDAMGYGRPNYGNYAPPPNYDYGRGDAVRHGQNW